MACNKTWYNFFFIEYTTIDFYLQVTLTIQLKPQIQWIIRIVTLNDDIHVWLKRLMYSNFVDEFYTSIRFPSVLLSFTATSFRIFQGTSSALLRLGYSQYTFYYSCPWVYCSVIDCSLNELWESAHHFVDPWNELLYVGVHTRQMFTSTTYSPGNQSY